MFNWRAILELPLTLISNNPKTCAIIIAALLVLEFAQLAF